MVGNTGHGYIQQARKCFFLSLGCFLVMGLLLCGESRRVVFEIGRASCRERV